jgi:hypothetical protein
MNLHRVDLAAIASFVAGGGLSGVFAFVAATDPAHAAVWGAAAGAALSVGGLIRVISNPTPTNSIQLTDRATGATVQVRTVDKPAVPVVPVQPEEQTK